MNPKLKIPLKLPRPGEKIDTTQQIVIASTWLNDDYQHDFPESDISMLGLVIVLEPRPPYYCVTQIATRHNNGWSMEDPRWHYNIVEAVEDYSNSGGDI